MRYSNIDSIPQLSRVVALGLFDSLHCGHLAVIKELLRVSHDKNLVSTVQTFSDFYLKGNRNVMTLDERIEILNELGVQDEIVLEFTDELKDIEPEEFVDRYVIDKLNAKCVVVGFDYRFGKFGRGDTVLLNEILREKKIELIVVSPVMTDDGTRKVSTSQIKKLLDDGKVQDVYRYCDERYYAYSGVIVKGNQIGRILGFPTINIQIPDEKYIARKGVYLTKTIIDGKEYSSISNIGLKPTIEEKEKRFIIETHLYDFNSNVYDKVATVKLIEFIRDEIKFSGLKELQQQVLLDKDKGYQRHFEVDMIGGKTNDRG